MKIVHMSLQVIRPGEVSSAESTWIPLSRHDVVLEQVALGITSVTNVTWMLTGCDVESECPKWGLDCLIYHS